MEPTKKTAEQGSDATRLARESKSALLAHDLEAARDLAAERVHETAASPEDAEARVLEAGNANKRLELFYAEHDPTGAWKGERLGRDLAAGFRQRWSTDEFSGEIQLERNEQGERVVKEADQRSHLLLVNMGELDRLNASGDHALGDLGLRATAERIEAVVREVLSSDPSYTDPRALAGAYEIYRHSGNDFAVNLPNADQSHAEEIRRRLTEQPVDLSALGRTEEPIPLTASRVSRAEGLELLNRLDTSPAEAGLSEQKVLIQAMLEKLQTLNDVDKVEKRSGRMVDKILKAGTSVDAEAQSRDFYEKFLKKSLAHAFKSGETGESLDFDGFRRLVKEKGGLDFPVKSEWIHFVAERAISDAFESLVSRRSVGREIDLKLAHAVAADTLKNPEKFGLIIDAEARPVSSRDFETPLETSGKEILTKLKTTAQEATAHAAEGPIQKLKADEATLSYELEDAKRDSRTGLLQRGAYFGAMEQGMKEKRPVSTVAIDMAFLKYFDKEGGPAAGDLAISKAAEILDIVAGTLSNSKITVEAYRVGGDEFALTIIGGDNQADHAETVKNVLGLLRDAERNAGRVPAQPGAKQSYRSEGLSFNYGIRMATDPEVFRTELETAGIPLHEQGEPSELNELADYLVRIADKEVELHKGVNRVMLLLSRTMEAKSSGEEGNLETLKAYSQKALFGQAGVAKIDEFAARLAASKDPQIELGKIRGETLAFVIDQIDKKNSVNAAFEGSLDRRLKDAVRTRYLEGRIEELEDTIFGLESELLRERESKGHLTSALQAAQEERNAVVELREKLSGAPPSSKTPPPMSLAA